MQPQRLPNGGILVPHGEQDAETGAFIDGVVEVHPGDDLYAVWDAWVEQAQPSEGPLT